MIMGDWKVAKNTLQEQGIHHLQLFGCNVVYVGLSLTPLGNRDVINTL